MRDPFCTRIHLHVTHAAASSSLSSLSAIASDVTNANNVIPLRTPSRTRSCSLPLIRANARPTLSFLFPSPFPFAVRIPRFSSFVLRLSPKSFLILTRISSSLCRIDVDPIYVLISDKNQIFVSYDFRLIVWLRNAITRSRSFPVSRASYFPRFNRTSPLFLVPFVASRFLFLRCSILVVVRENFL